MSRSRAITAAITLALTATLGTWLSLAGGSTAAAQDGAARAHRDAQPAAARVRAIEAIGMTVSDLDRSIEFYTSVLEFEHLSTTELEGDALERLLGVFGARVRIATLRLGDEDIELIEFLAPSNGRSFPEDTRGNDRWFQHIAIIVSDMDRAFERLREHAVDFGSTGPQRLPDWNLNAGGIEAFYFRDPDGRFLEVLAFPPGKGDPRWHEESDRLFLGIDHTAIVVDDTDEALAFYRDTFGMRVAGESENWGIEQERLNNVFGARLRITALRAAAGPAIELLEYLTPRDGRPAPRDTKANDLWHWHIRAEISNAQASFSSSRAGGGSPVSPGAQLTEWPGSEPAPSQLVRDPDLHSLILIER